MAAAQVQCGLDLGAGPGPVVAFEQRGAPGQAGERLQVRFGRQSSRSVVTQRSPRGRAAPVGEGFSLGAANCSAAACRTARSDGVVAGPAPPRVPQVGPGRGQVAGLELGQAAGQGQPRVGRGGLGIHAGERAAQCSVVAGEDQWHGEAVQQLRQQRGVAAAGGVVQGVDRLILACPPVGRGGVQLGGPGGSLALQVGGQVGAQEFLDAVGVAVVSGGGQQRGLVGEPVEQAPGVFPAGQLGGQPGRDGVADADHSQELPDVVRERGEDLPDQVVGDRAVVAGELVEERVAVGGPGERECGQPQPGDPAAGALVQGVDLGGGEAQTGSFEQGGRLGGGEAQPVRAKLAQPAGEAQPGQRQRRVEPGGQDELETGGTVAQQGLQAVQGDRVDELVHVVEDQPDRPGQLLHGVAELGEELRLGAGLPHPGGVQAAARRHRRAGRERGHHRRPQPLRVVVVAVQAHPGGVEPVDLSDPVLAWAQSARSIVLP